MKTSFCLLLVVALTAPTLRAPLVAQTPSGVEVGARVRIMTTGSYDWNAIGNIVRVTSDTIELTVPSAHALPAFRRADISALEVSSRERHALPGMAIGTLAGATTGVAIGFASGGLKCNHYPGASDCTDVPDTAIAAILGVGLGVLGGAVGLVVGGLVSTEVWSPLSKDAIVAPIAGDRGRIGLSIRF